MTPERWRQVTRIYGAVLTKAPEVRAAALAELCPDDEALRKEVESLLADHSGGALLDRPVGEVASSLVDQNLSGRTLGPYQLNSAIGAGGMGQVYRANDTRLHRTVAIKVLAPSLAHDAQFRARFDREAKAIASLNHPHICTLYDVGSSDGIDYLVMEYVEGETLSTRLERGALPFDQALTAAIQIAEALAAAHRQGIVHRDLKPGNVMLTKEGAKLLDFGLAKPSQSATMAGALSMLPTTPPVGPTRGGPLTVQGTILGTLQYMAPEQLEGKDTDARTDIFAFGAIVYEMLTGKRAFNGGSQASLIGAIMHADPPSMAAGQPLTPPALERLVRTCLVKEPDQRWQNAADLARELKSIGESPSQSGIPHAQKSRRSPLNPAVAVIALVVAAGISGYVGYRVKTVPTPAAVQFSISAPTDGFFAPNPGGFAPAIAVSPDGRWLVYSVSIPPAAPRLWIRGVDSLDARPLQGTEGARYPFWSLDNHSLGFFTQVALKRTDVAGGAPRQIANVEDGAGGTWSKRGAIVFGTVSHGLFTVSDEGGAVAPLHPAGDTGGGRMPVFLPDDRYFVYWNRRGESSEGDIRLASVDGKEAAVLVSAARGVGLFGGHLFFVRGETLFAQPFDINNRTIAGPAIAIADGIAGSSSGGYASFAASDTGVLLLGRTATSTRQARWIDRKGTRLQSVAAPMTQTGIKLSADEGQLLSVRPDSSTIFNTLWNYDIKRGAESRVAAGGQPIFSRDGKWIAYIQMPSMRGIARIRSDGTGDAETILDRLAWPSDWSQDGRKILTYYPAAETGIDMGVIDVENHQLTPLIQAVGDQGAGRFSPDQESIAYVSTDTGRLEVLVRSSTTGEQVHVSSGDGGSEPRWRRDGKELFYLGNDRTLMAVKIDHVNGHLSAGIPTPLFQANVGPVAGLFGLDYEASDDGQRFLVNELTAPFSTPNLTVIVNWPALPKIQQAQ